LKLSNFLKYSFLFILSFPKNTLAEYNVELLKGFATIVIRLPNSKPVARYRRNIKESKGKCPTDASLHLNIFPGTQLSSGA